MPSSCWDAEVLTEAIDVVRDDGGWSNVGPHGRTFDFYFLVFEFGFFEKDWKLPEAPSLIEGVRTPVGTSNCDGPGIRAAWVACRTGEFRGDLGCQHLFEASP